MNRQHVWYAKTADAGSPDTYVWNIKRYTNIKKTVGESTVREVFFHNPKKHIPLPHLILLKKIF